MRKKFSKNYVGELLEFFFKFDKILFSIKFLTMLENIIFNIDFLTLMVKFVYFNKLKL